MEPMRTIVTFSLDPELRSRFDAIAEQTRHSRSALARHVLGEWVAMVESAVAEPSGAATEPAAAPDASEVRA